MQGRRGAPAAGAVAVGDPFRPSRVGKPHLAAGAAAAHRCRFCRLRHARLPFAMSVAEAGGVGDGGGG